MYDHAIDLVRKGANPYDHDINGRSKSAISLAAEIEDDRYAVEMAVALMDPTHNSDSPIFDDEIFSNAIWRQDTNNGSLFFAILNRELIPNDLDFVLEVLLNAYKRDKREWNDQEVNALLNVNKPIYSAGSAEKTVLSALALAILKGPKSPATAKDITHVLNRFLAKGVDIQAEAQGVVETAFRARNRSDAISSENFEIRIRAIIDWVLRSKVRVVATDDLFEQAMRAGSEYLFDVLVSLGPENAQGTNFYKVLFVWASESTEATDIGIRRLDKLLSAKFVPSPDIGSTILSRFLTWVCIC